jgi:ribonuclease G
MSNKIFPGGGAACASAPRAASGHGPAKTRPRSRPGPRRRGGGRAAPSRCLKNATAHEIERAENIAAGLPPRDCAGNPAPDRRARKKGISASRISKPPGCRRKNPFKPVPVKEQPKGIVDTIRAAATTLVKKVQRLIKPEKKSTRKSSSTPRRSKPASPCLEEGRLEEFNIERTTEERLVGSIFKGKVRNLEDGLKAAFVDIGFEKNAFLHYWDIVPNQFDSGVEIVERPTGAPARPKITQKDIPRLYPPGSEIIVQVTKGPIGTKGPRVTTNLVLPGRYLVLLPNSDQSGISRKIENQEERQRLKKILRELAIPDGMGVIMRTAGEGQQKRYFVRDLALLLEEWNGVQERIKKQPPGHLRLPGAGFDRTHRARLPDRRRRTHRRGQPKSLRPDARDDFQNLQAPPTR